MEVLILKAEQIYSTRFNLRNSSKYNAYIQRQLYSHGIPLLLWLSLCSQPISDISLVFLSKHGTSWRKALLQLRNWHKVYSLDSSCIISKKHLGLNHYLQPPRPLTVSVLFIWGMDFVVTSQKPNYSQNIVYTFIHQTHAGLRESLYLGA